MFCRKANSRVLLITAVVVWGSFAILFVLRKNYVDLLPDYTLLTSQSVWIPSGSAYNLSLVSSVSRRQPNRSGMYWLPDKGVWVRKDGDFLVRISHYNDVVYNVSRHIMASRGSRPWQTLASDKATVIVNGTSADYLSKLGSVPNVTAVVLAWSDSDGTNWTSLSDRSNLLLQEYYPLTGCKAFCDRIRGREPFTRHRFETVFDHQCSTNVSDAFRVASLEPYFINSVQMHRKYYWPNNGDAWPSHFYTDLPRYVTYVHIIQDAVVNQLGEVFTANYKIIPYNCHPALNTRTPRRDRIKDLPLYDEVLSLSQYWGAGFYHKNLEDFPKLGPYLEFLKRRPTVKIQVFEKGTYTQLLMKYLGIDSSRLISGDARAHVVYLPRGTSCGTTHIQETQLFSHHLRASIRPPAAKKRRLILIRRSKHRHLVDMDKIAEKLEVVAKDFGLKFYLFRDDPVPPLDETGRQFNGAALVVAPHGAGLSNVLFSEPKTVVLEAVCNPPHTNLCYARLARLLGMRYHALISRGGCEGHVDVPPEEVEKAARSLLEELRRRHEI